MVDIKDYKVLVTDAPYNAKGDGVTNDRAAIQQAIDDVHAQGGGTVVFTGGKTFLTGNILLKNNIELHFEDGATLLQSSERNDYVKPVDGGYEVCPPLYGHNVVEGVKWSHAWYYSLPFIHAPEGTHDIKITGNGTIYMMPVENHETLLRIAPIGFYRVKNFEVTDITVTNYHSYCMMIYTCNDGLFKNIKINNNNYGNGDGISLMNCQNIRITECDMETGDDSVYIFVSYKDPRKSSWWSSDDPQPSINIEVDHNHLVSNNCKGFGMILWGAECPDQRKVEVRDVYIHDNYFRSMGNWLMNPFTTKEIYYPPVTHVRFENNKIGEIEENFFETQISDVNYFHCMTAMHNGNFESAGLGFWSTRKNSDPDSVGVGYDKVGQDGEAYGYIKNLENGDAAIYQGLYLKCEELCNFSAKVQTSGDPCRMFVKDLDTQELIVSKEISNTEWQYEDLVFKVPKSGNYHVGIERGDATKGWARIDNARLLGNFDPAFGYKHVYNNDGKVTFVMNDFEG